MTEDLDRFIVNSSPLQKIADCTAHNHYMHMEQNSEKGLNIVKSHFLKASRVFLSPNADKGTNLKLLILILS